MRQAHSFGVEAVVLRHADYDEVDRIVTLFTRQLGKTRASVKGARKITSRKAGHLEPFTHVKLQFARGRDMPLITQADTLNGFLPMREDLVLTSQASYVLELVDRFTYDEGTDRSGVFRLLIETLERLSARADPWMTTRYYEMRLLDHLGFLFDGGRDRPRECDSCHITNCTRHRHTCNGEAHPSLLIRGIARAHRDYSDDRSRSHNGDEPRMT